ncbi:hypothetical protein BH20BAC1_BH20BAC1_11660 [soil metagenome]
MHQEPSAASNTWKRLSKNKGAIAGLVIISLAIILGILAYVIANDATPNADRQIVELGAKPPGFTQLFLKIKKKRNIAQTNMLKKVLYGAEDKFIYLPVNAFEWHGDTLVVDKYIDEGVSEIQFYPKDFLPKEKPVVTKKFWLGTDKFGRDILSRLIVGIRVSLAVGLITVIISLSIGISLGAIAGYYGGRIDNVIMWLINVIWSMPTLLLVFGITLALGKGFWQIFIAVGLTMWVNVARIIRGQVIALRELEYIQAAKALGLTGFRIIRNHIFPNVLGPVMVIAASNFASAIIIEAGLSFLGVGVQPPTPSWGLMIKENYNFIITHNPALALVPGVAIMILVLAFNLLGNGLRDAFDVRG